VLAALAATVLGVTNVGVGVREWRISAYVPEVKRGVVVLNVHNFGEDGHDLRVRGPRRFRSAILPEVPAGGNGRLTVTLSRRGRYVLVCTLPGHEALGMRATVRVR
jgi:plastocyanin